MGEEVYDDVDASDFPAPPAELRSLKCFHYNAVLTRRLLNNIELEWNSSVVYVYCAQSCGLCSPLLKLCLFVIKALTSQSGLLASHPNPPSSPLPHPFSGPQTLVLPLVPWLITVGCWWLTAVCIHSSTGNVYLRFCSQVISMIHLLLFLPFSPTFSPLEYTSFESQPSSFFFPVLHQWFPLWKKKNKNKTEFVA